MAISAGRTGLVGPLAAINLGEERSLTVTRGQLSPAGQAHMTGSDGTDSQADRADSAGSASAVARSAVVSLQPRVRCRALRRAGGSWPRG
jgi:hypothetical protein